MCGIAGIVARVPFYGADVIERMAESISHRGPDGDGFIALSPGAIKSATAISPPERCPAEVWLGHRRLSVIDPVGSRQPLRNENGSVWVTFNGEIYNYKILRKQLEQKGHRFRTNGDGEVLAHLWEEYGEKMLEPLIGMFSLAVYDVERRSLFLARDRYGKKPLYYWDRPEIFAFASELGALKYLPQFPFGQLDLVAAAQYFRYGYIPSPRTIYQDVASLPPGHYALYENGHKRVEEYWRPRVHGIDHSIGLDRLQDSLDDAVALRLRSDVPLGALLSGGIDSSLVVASMVKQSEEKVQTFTVGTRDKSSDESKIAGKIADHLGTRHKTFTVRPSLISVADILAHHYGQPFADYSSIPTYYVCEETRRHVTVALTGDGGDELFAGYQRYTNAGWSHLIGRIPFRLRLASALVVGALFPEKHDFSGRVKDFVLSANPAPGKGENASELYHAYHRNRAFQKYFADLLQIENNENVERFSQLFDRAESPNSLERWLEVDQRMYLCDDILSKVDIASMTVSLECRAPFLDHRFAEMVNRIPLSLKLNRRQTKISLRELASRRLPSEITNLPKRGFTLPLARWLRGDMSHWAQEIIFDHSETWEPYLQPSYVHELWRDHLTVKTDNSMRLWVIISWVLWYLSESKFQTAEHSITDAAAHASRV